jgi:hypothetical protein
MVLLVAAKADLGIYGHENSHKKDGKKERSFESKHVLGGLLCLLLWQR